MYLKECLSYFKSYGFNHLLPICTLRNKFCIFFLHSCSFLCFSMICMFMILGNIHLMHGVFPYCWEFRTLLLLFPDVSFILGNKIVLNLESSSITDYRLGKGSSNGLAPIRCHWAPRHIFLLVKMHILRLRDLMIGPHIVQIYTPVTKSCKVLITVASL